MTSAPGYMVAHHTLIVLPELLDYQHLRDTECISNLLCIEVLGLTTYATSLVLQLEGTVKILVLYKLCFIFIIISFLHLGLY